MKITNELEKLGIELSDEQKAAINKKFTEDVISVSEHEHKLSKLEVERDQIKEQFESAQETLKGFEGKDFDAITKERDEWMAKAEASAKEFEAQLQKRDYLDAINKQVESIEFSSLAAKKAFLSDLEANPLQVRDGKILGFDDYLKGAKESDPAAFIDSSVKESAKFTEPLGKIDDGVKQSTKTTADLRAVMGLPPETK